MDQVQTTGAPTTGAPTSAPGIANADAATRAKRQEFYDRLTPNSMAPLWEVLGNVVTPEPRVTSKPHLWKWDVSRKLLLEAGALLTAEEAERRVLVLENPAYPGESRATNTLYASPHPIRLALRAGIQGRLHRGGGRKDHHDAR
jgi:gentisate 1,2-dioxygenase